jgi:NAD(P)H dehydrogenase (quinone)
MKALILYYSLYNHTFDLANAVADGVRKIDGAEPVLRRVPETLPLEVLEKMGAIAAQKAQMDIPIATLADLEAADAIIIGAPTRFGNIVSQMGAFLDSTGGLWSRGALAGKVGSAFTSSATQHGGNETTLHAIHHFLLHHGLVVVGLPYTFAGQMRIDELTGGSPYGTTTIAGGDGSRRPSENELSAARFQGSHVARIGLKLAAG